MFQANVPYQAYGYIDAYVLTLAYKICLKLRLFWEECKSCRYTRFLLLYLINEIYLDCKLFFVWLSLHIFQ